MISSPEYVQGSISPQCFLQRQDLARVWTDFCSTIDSFLSIHVQPCGLEGQNPAEQMHTIHGRRRSDAARALISFSWRTSGWR